MTTYSVLHTFSVSKSLLLCKRKKKQLTPAFSPLLLLAKVANECFKCAKKVIRVYENTRSWYLSRNSVVFLLTPAP